MMTPDTLGIDRTFRGVGRLKKATGTRNPATRRRMNRMLTALFDDGRLDVLRAIRDGQLTLLEVLDAYTRRTLHALPVGDTARKLAPAFDAWLHTIRVPQDYSADHVRTMGTTLNYLTKHAPRAMVADLPAVLEALRETLGQTYPRSFNLTRAHCLAFVRSTLKRSHPIWLSVAAVEPRKVAPGRKHNPLTPDQMRHWFPAPTSDPVDAIAWSMATTGMGPKELWGPWKVLADRVRIAGTKRSARRRSVPLARTPEGPTIHPRTFLDAISTRSERQLTPYDMRRTYANWLESAGVPRTRRRIYLGHGTGDVTDLYELHEVAAYLAEDAQKIRQFAGLDAPDTPRLKLEA